MYLASVVDSATSDCFFELQDTAPPSIVKTYPDIEWRWCCKAPSASENPSNPILSHLSSSAHVQFPPAPMTNHRSIVPFKYLKTRLTSSQCGRPGFCMNCDRNMTVNIMSSQVPNVAYISKPIASQYGMFFMTAYWQGMSGHYTRLSLWCGSSGVDKGWTSCNPNRLRILAIYAHCENAIVLAFWSRSTCMPSIHRSSPRSLILTSLASPSLNYHMTIAELPAIIMSSTSTVTIIAWSWSYR